MQWDYPAIDGVSADLLLVTHEHFDHNAVDVIGGDPTILRSTAGKLESPIGEVVAVASEHDQAAGTERGPNTIFVFSFDGLRVAHFGDFGQAALRDEQAAAIGDVDLIFLPVGAGPTIDADQAREIVDRLRPKWVVPMHYRTPKIGFLEPARRLHREVRRGAPLRGDELRDRRPACGRGACRGRPVRALARWPWDAGPRP